jgi:hypothetical protein
MIAWLLTPLLLLLLVIVQVAVSSVLTWGWITLEISLVVTIYAAFHLGAFRGGLVAFLLGFFLDCLTSTLFGLYIFIYVSVFALSLLVAGRVYGEKTTLIAVFTALCVLWEGALITLSYCLFTGTDLLWTMAKTIAPQAVVVGLLSPFCFNLFHRLGIFVDAADTRSPGPL